MRTIGYDLYTENKPPEIVELERRLYGENGDTLVAHAPVEREALLKQLWQLQESTHSYFRLNIFGMAEYRRHMDRVGMLSDATNGPFPTRDDDMDDITYRDAVMEHIAYDSGGPGIPAEKLGSNDGWLVTPAECDSAVEVWNAWAQNAFGDRSNPGSSAAKVLTGPDANGWLDWIEFIARASERGGFRVW